MKKGFVVVLGLVVAAMLAVVIISLMTVKSEAKSDFDNKVKTFETIDVQSGDTLWSISERYAESFGVSTKEYVKELKKLNSMDSDFLVSGSRMLVVYYE